MGRGGCILMFVCGAAMSTGCTGSSPPSTPSTGTAGPAQTITGAEHLGWDQQASDSTTLASILYAIYVDGARSQLAGASCATAQTSTGFACTAPLPVISAGAHTLALASFFVGTGTTVLESPQSSLLNVVVVAAGQNRQASSKSQGEPAITTADNVQLRLDVVTAGLERPTDIAFVPDGRIFIAERAGRVRVVRDGRLRAPPALTLDDVAAEGQAGLLGLALDPGFDRTGFVYALYTTPSRSDSTAFRLARFRAVGDTLADRAILLDNIEASPQAAASLRFGPDGKLYAAFDDGGNPIAAGDLSSFNGKVLRMNANGSTPDDNPAATPVFSEGHPSPRGLDWQPATGALWIVDAEAQPAARLSVVVAIGSRSKRGTTRTSYRLLASMGPSALAFYRGGLIPAFRDNLLVAAEQGGYLLRIRFDPQDGTRIVGTEPLLQNRVGGVLGVATGPDGSIYVCTATTLLRLAPTGGTP